MNDKGSDLRAAPRGTAELIVTNNGGWAAARVDALAQILAVHRIMAVPHPLYETRGPCTDRSGARRLRLSGVQVRLDPLIERIIPDLLERMQAGLDAALRDRAGARGRRPGDAPEPADRNARCRQRREFGRRYLHAWGAAWAQRSQAALAAVPEARRDDNTGLLAHSGDPASARAHADVDALDFWLFDHAIVLRRAGIDADVEELIGSKHAGSAFPAPSDPAPRSSRSRRDRIRFGAPADGGQGRWRTDVVIRADGDRAAVRAAALIPVIRALGGAMRTAEDRFGQLTGYVAGDRAVVQTLCQHLGALLDLAEYSATVAIRDQYAPSLAAAWTGFSPSRRQALRRAWRLDYLSAFGIAMGERLTSAIAGGADAARLRHRVERRGWQESDEASSAIHAEVRARADVDRLDAQRFHALAIAVGNTPIQAVEPAVAKIQAKDAIEPRSPGERIAVTGAGGYGAVRLAALTPIAQAWQLRITPDPYEPNQGIVVGHARLAGVFSAQLQELTAMMNVAASAVARPRGVARRRRSDRGYEQLLNDFSQAYADRLQSGINFGVPQRPSGATTDAAADVPATHIDEAAIHIASVTCPQLFGGCANDTVMLAVAPGAFCSAADRTAVITAVAASCGVTATLAGYVEEGRRWELVREVLRLDGPAPVLTAFVAAIEGLLNTADAVLAASLPACEATLNAGVRTARDPRTRHHRRQAWATRVMSVFGACYAQRLTATNALSRTAPLPPMGAVGAAEIQVARAGVEAIDGDEFAVLSASVVQGWDRTRSAWVRSQSGGASLSVAGRT